MKTLAQREAKGQVIDTMQIMSSVSSNFPTALKATS